MLALKRGSLVGSPPKSVSEVIAERITTNAAWRELFAQFLHPSAVLVPVPKSSLHREGSLWVPEQLSNALVHARLGGRATALISRTRPIPKAATSPPAERPTAQDHYSSLVAQYDVSPVSELLLVDDIVTSGAALLGCANRLREVYADIPVRGFAAIRTLTDESSLHRIVDPQVGEIVLRPGGRTRRTP